MGSFALRSVHQTSSFDLSNTAFGQFLLDPRGDDLHEAFQFLSVMGGYGWLWVVMGGYGRLWVVMCGYVWLWVVMGGPAGSTVGLLEYLSQSNDSANCVDKEDRFKFVDDLSILEIVNLLTVGITSFNLKAQVPNDIATHNQYIPPENLLSQQYLDNINKWTTNNKMLINQKKTKTIIFNFTNKYQFSTVQD